jgi:hypothetical protein
MTFIEQWLGISPDGGSGWFEVVVLVVLAAGVAVTARRVRVARGRFRWRA